MPAMKAAKLQAPPPTLHTRQIHLFLSGFTSSDGFSSLPWIGQRKPSSLPLRLGSPNSLHSITSHFRTTCRTGAALLAIAVPLERVRRRPPRQRPLGLARCITAWAMLGTVEAVLVQR